MLSLRVEMKKKCTIEIANEHFEFGTSKKPTAHVSSNCND